MSPWPLASASGRCNLVSGVAPVTPLGNAFSRASVLVPFASVLDSALASARAAILVLVLVWGLVLALVLKSPLGQWWGLVLALAHAAIFLMLVPSNADTSMPRPLQHTRAGPHALQTPLWK